MFNWTDYFREDESNTLIHQWIQSEMAEQNRLADEAIEAALSPADRWLCERYLAGGMQMDAGEFSDMLEYEYMAVWHGWKFAWVERKEKTNGKMGQDSAR